MKISEKIKHEIHFVIAGILLIFGTLGIMYSVYAYPRIFDIEISMDNRADIQPKEPVTIHFSEPMIAGQTDNSIKVVPQVDVEYSWSDNNRLLVVNPVGYWKPGQTYSIYLEDVKSVMLTEKSVDLSFDTVDYPGVSDFYPAAGAKDVALDIEDPIKVTFDRDISQFKTKFVIKPFENLAYKLDEEKKAVSLIAEEELQKGETYEISVYVRHKDEPGENYSKIYATSFETLPPPPPTWDQDKNLRIEQARKFTIAQIKTGKYIDINVTSQVMTIFEEGSLLDAFLVSSGKASMPTPLGEFGVRNKFPRAWSKKYGLYMPYWMAMVPSGQFGIHELPEWPGGFKEGQSHLGTPVSHGCIRLGVGPAERVYNWAEIGTPVVIHK